MTIFIFLDDVRMPPDDGNLWILARDIDRAWVELVYAWHHNEGQEIVLSLDHDLGQDKNGKDLDNGNDLVKRIEKAVATQYGFKPKLEMRIHSANPVGQQNMEAGIRSIYRLLEKQ